MGLLSLLFPRHCVFCGLELPERANGGSELCAQCRGNLPWWGQSERVGRTEVTAPLSYEGSARRAMINFKFNGKRHYARAFSELVSVCVRNYYGTDFDAVTYVPLHWLRRWRRGYTQTKLLAIEIGRELGIIVKSTLRKPRARKANSGLTAEARAVSVHGAFRVTADVQGKRFLLIDDVCTTGSTLSECAEVLLNAGASEVLCAAVCKTMK